MLCPNGFAIVDQVVNAWCSICEAKVNMDVAHCCKVCGCRNAKSDSSSEDIETVDRLINCVRWILRYQLYRQSGSTPSESGSTIQFLQSERLSTFSARLFNTFQHFSTPNNSILPINQSSQQHPTNQVNVILQTSIFHSLYVWGDCKSLHICIHPAHEPVLLFTSALSR